MAEWYKKVCSYIKAQKCIKDGDVDAMIISKNKGLFGHTCG